MRVPFPASSRFRIARCLASFAASLAAPFLAALLAGAASLAGAQDPRDAPGAPSADPVNGRPGTRSSIEPLTPAAAPLPPAIAAALDRAQVPASALALWVQPVDAAGPAQAWNADAAMIPASVFKLATTAAALDLLGPAWTWKTPVWFGGPVRRGVLQGSLYIRGSGDPSLVLERTWLLLRRVRDAGIREIHGDIVLDHGLFAPPEGSPADFDGAPSEPYNVLPDALLLNYKAVTLSFLPDPAARVARVVAEPPLAGVVADASVPLLPGACGDWRGGLRLGKDDPSRWHFAGGYPASCGPRNWPLAYADPAGYDARLIAALWRESGGTLRGDVHDGPAPADAAPAFEFESPPLAEVVRDINKYSNNVMAEQVFLTLAAQPRPPGDPLSAATPGASSVAPADPAGAAEPRAGSGGATRRQAAALLAQWLRARLGAAAGDATIANGSGLARETRLNARTLGSLLQWTWRSPAMPELASSLPLNGIDGTLRHAGSIPGRAHLKTGSMRDVLAVAGYVLGDSGRRYVLVAIVNAPNAGAARPALDAAIDWTAHDAPPPPRP